MDRYRTGGAQKGAGSLCLNFARFVRPRPSLCAVRLCILCRTAAVFDRTRCHPARPFFLATLPGRPVLFARKAARHSFDFVFLQVVVVLRFAACAASVKACRELSRVPGRTTCTALIQTAGCVGWSTPARLLRLNARARALVETSLGGGAGDNSGSAIHASRERPL